MSLPGAIDHAHAAATDLLENVVISQLQGLVWRVHVAKYGFINPLRYLATSFQSLAEQTAHAESCVESQGCSTAVAFCILFRTGRKRIGASIRICHCNHSVPVASDAQR